MRGYDIIGDIHGSGEKLLGLLELLGWRPDGAGGHGHAEADRQVIFVGDLIDRGPDQRAVLQTVRSMVDAGRARIVMGNHELNAVGYATEHPGRPGASLREHSVKNQRQHEAFLTQVDADERAHWIGWFATLPLWLDLDGVRVVHACWHQPSIDLLERTLGGNRFPDGAAGLELWAAAHEQGSAIHQAIEVVLKGPELTLRDYGLPPFVDKGGDVRDAARVRWWYGDATSIRDLIDLPPATRQADGSAYPVIPATACSAADRSFAYRAAVPVVYGHHWRSWEPDEDLDWTQRTACVDFSAAKGGPLVAYCWRGEAEIDREHYVPYPAVGLGD